MAGLTQRQVVAKLHYPEWTGRIGRYRFFASLCVGGGEAQLGVGLLMRGGTSTVLPGFTLSVGLFIGPAMLEVVRL